MSQYPLMTYIRPQFLIFNRRSKVAHVPKVLVMFFRRQTFGESICNVIFRLYVDHLHNPILNNLLHKMVLDIDVIGPFAFMVVRDECGTSIVASHYDGIWDRDSYESYHLSHEQDLFSYLHKGHIFSLGSSQRHHFLPTTSPIHQHPVDKYCPSGNAPSVLHVTCPVTVNEAGKYPFDVCVLFYFVSDPQIPTPCHIFYYTQHQFVVMLRAFHENFG